MHEYDAQTDELARAVIDYALARVRMNPPPLDGPRSAEELARIAGPTITDAGLGGMEALRIFRDVLAPATVSSDHPRFLAFVPTAPTEAAVLADLVVGASSIYGGSWLEGAGAVHAENEALRFLADEAGLPPEAGGVFVSGGTAGNLSALVAARHREASTRSRPDRWVLVASSEAHSSVASAAGVMDVDVSVVDIEPGERLGGRALADHLDGLDAPTRRGVFAVVATAGTTNLGLVDDLTGIASVCRDQGVWLHVDAAYGGGALLAPSTRPLFDGIESCDSLIIDPHKWLFAPYDCCALLYRSPDVARAAHTQHAGYLAPLESGDWNPSDLANHLTRRVRGVPFWFSLATHGVAAYRRAVQATLETASRAAALIEADPVCELVFPPELSVVVFRRVGWELDDYAEWSERVLRRGLALVTPTQVLDEWVLRLCFVNPQTTPADVELILASLH